MCRLPLPLAVCSKEGQQPAIANVASGETLAELVGPTLPLLHFKNADDLLRTLSAVLRDQ
jgi:hypothetical protein